LYQERRTSSPLLVGSFIADHDAGSEKVPRTSPSSFSGAPKPYSVMLGDEKPCSNRRVVS
jgi:hypothetical protein